MVDEEKLKQMTKLAIYEEGEGKKALEISEYNRWDYVTMQMVKGWIYSTISFAALAGGELVYKDFALLDDFVDGVAPVLIKLILHYLVLEVIYQVICFFVYNIRYTRAEKGKRRYYGLLSRLVRYYGKEDDE
ncbi:hypothetical protein [Eubacterium oxidoreducens]|uniref:Uncharacterized protein n=1 Tax=Eubacterium oxidoreducens TaxID=1732 RepID=A0A1G6AD11_EUBOX|nr:hypothetical protein [Eubacterium oxidoreducens]SDB06269.1 hypothetical protein SAMN02910417_00437 [Eubacterium oxidoreducens]